MNNLKFRMEWGREWYSGVGSEGECKRERKGRMSLEKEGDGKGGGKGVNREGDCYRIYYNM